MAANTPPFSLDRVREFPSLVFDIVREVGVTESADRAAAIRLYAAPKSALGEPAEHCRPSRPVPLTLQLVEDLVYEVGHRVTLDSRRITVKLAIAARTSSGLKSTGSE